MAPQSIEKFKKYLENQNDDFLLDVRRVEGIIRDIFPEEKALISLLTNAWKAGVVTELRQTANLEVTIAQFADRLCQEYSLRESSALAAVRVWAYVLGVTDFVPDINVSSTSSFINQSSITPETKKCPFCAEEIKKDARRCKHCHSDITDDEVVNEAQNKELIRQQEALHREKQKLARERQEIETLAVIEAKQKKPEAQHRELHEIVERKTAKVNGMVEWNGMWFLVDTITEVKLDGSQIGHGSVKKGFQIPFTTTTGVHVLTLKVPMRGEKTYQLIFDENGNYRVTVQFSRLLGNWGEACLTTK